MSLHISVVGFQISITNIHICISAYKTLLHYSNNPGSKYYCHLQFKNLKRNLERISCPKSHRIRISLGLFCLGFTQLPKFVGFCLFAAFGNFPSVCLWLRLQLCPLSLFSPGLCRPNGRSSPAVPKAPEALFDLLSLLSLCCSDRGAPIVCPPAH